MRGEAKADAWRRRSGALPQPFARVRWRLRQALRLALRLLARIWRLVLRVFVAMISQSYAMREIYARHPSTIDG